MVLVETFNRLRSETMTRRDFELIAGVLKDTVDSAWQGSFWPENERILEGLVESMTNALSGTNPRFDRERFMRACGF